MITSGPLMSGIGCGEHHGRPAALAVADDDRLRRFRMAPGDLLDEFRLGAHDVGERLPGFGMGAEGDEIDRVAVGKRDADLTVLLEAADACPVSRARIDDHVRPLPVENLHAFRRQNLEKHVIDGRLRLVPSTIVSLS